MHGVRAGLEVGKQRSEKQGSGRYPQGLLGRSRLRGPHAQAQGPGQALRGRGFPSQETHVPSLGLPIPEKAHMGGADAALTHTGQAGSGG